MKRIACILLLCACSQEPERSHQMQFKQIDSGIGSVECGSEPQETILEVNGCGVALLDYDNDGDLDFFLTSSGTIEEDSSSSGCRLYENVSSESGIKFVDVTEESGISIDTHAMGVAIGDINGDTFDDIYVTCFGPNRLLVNNGDGAFVEQGESANVHDDGWGTSAAFGDLDVDGDLDLYVCNYLEFDVDNVPRRAKYKGVDVLGGPHGLTPQQDIVYENNGDGTFENATEKWGFDSTPAFGLNVAILDLNDDGKQDVYVGNDSMANSLYINQGEGFVDSGFHSGAATNGEGSMQATMGIAVGDVNGDNLPDIFTTNFSSDTNTLHVNSESGFFSDRTNAYGLGLSSRMLLGWTTAFEDFDGDGHDDLIILNGHVYPNATMASMDSNRLQPVVTMSGSPHRFEQVNAIDGAFDDRAGVFGDLDGDGDVDLVIAPRHGAVRVYENVGAPPSVLKLTLGGSGQNTKGLGAKVTVQFDDGTTKSKWNHDGSGFQSSMSVPLLFTFPKNVKPVSLDIVWADGHMQRVPVTDEKMHVTQE